MTAGAATLTWIVAGMLRVSDRQIRWCGPCLATVPRLLRQDRGRDKTGTAPADSTERPRPDPVEWTVSDRQPDLDPSNPR